ncbi:hypothetical protein PPACK8108_LOCUS25210 [Phakopsora pachyrhizi]|uniref:Uncharacterized protein n=1 Tax=Phakopsora pachyrhizi TaxID=170000 RepID=A0AAV0BRH1_PHAPC|nr:hypothetical protein PPACK8108_LOCUS25210 [Phakopsora pachyrhizi]
MTLLATYLSLLFTALFNFTTGMLPSKESLTEGTNFFIPIAPQNRINKHPATLQLMPLSSLNNEHIFGSENKLNNEIEMIDFWKISERKKRPQDQYLEPNEQFSSKLKKKQFAEGSLSLRSHGAEMGFSQSPLPILSLSLGSNPQVEEFSSNFNPVEISHKFKIGLDGHEQVDGYLLASPTNDANTAESNKGKAPLSVDDRISNRNLAPMETLERSSRKAVESFFENESRMSPISSMQPELNPSHHATHEQITPTQAPENFNAENVSENEYAIFPIAKDSPEIYLSHHTSHGQITLIFSINDGQHDCHPTHFSTHEKITTGQTLKNINAESLSEKENIIYSVNSEKYNSNPTNHLVTTQHGRTPEVSQSSRSSSKSGDIVQKKKNGEINNNVKKIHTGILDRKNSRSIYKEDEYLESSNSKYLENVAWMKKARTPILRKKRLLTEIFNTQEKKEKKPRVASASNDPERSDVQIRNSESIVTNFEADEMQNPSRPDTFAQQLEDIWPKILSLEKPNSPENPLLFLIDYTDKLADKILSNLNPAAKGGKKIAQGKVVADENTLNRLLDHGKIALEKSLFDNLRIKFRKTLDANLKRSALKLLRKIEKQIQRNHVGDFYVGAADMKGFFTEDKVETFYVKWPLKKISMDGATFFEKVSRMVFDALKSIQWKNVYVDDKMNEIFERRASLLITANFPQQYLAYSINIKLRYRLRRLFLVYSTLINKICCEGKEDLERNFHNWQKDAINSFDKAWNLIEIEKSSYSKKHYYGNSFIANKKLPLSKKKVIGFLDTYDIKRGAKRNIGLFKFRATSHLRPQHESVWKFIALWLAEYRYDLYCRVFSKEDKTINKLKPFLNALICFITFKIDQKPPKVS